MDLVELLKQVVEELSPFVEGESIGRMSHDPDRDIETVVVAAGRVLDKGLLIGRGY